MINKQSLKTIGSQILKASFQAAQIGRQIFWLVGSRFNNAVTYIAKSVWQLLKSIKALFIKIFRAMLKPLGSKFTNAVTYIAKKTKASFQASQIKRRALWLINSKFTNTFIYAPKSVWQLLKSIRALFIKIFRAMLKPLKSIGSWVFDEQIEIWEMISGVFRAVFFKKNKRQLIGIIGSVILIISALTPIFFADIPLTKKDITLNLFNINGLGWFIWALGIISIILISYKKYKWLQFAGGLSFAFLPIALVTFYLKETIFEAIIQKYIGITWVTEVIARLAANRIELEWGLIVLFLGTFLILISTIKISNPFNITR